LRERTLGHEASLDLTHDEKLRSVEYLNTIW
jgi:hypothetical protein